MDVISKSIILPKIGSTRITFFRDRRRATKDKTAFSLPFEMQLPNRDATGEIVYSPVFRSCRVLWSDPPEDLKIREEAERFIKEFLFGTLMSATEPIEPLEADSIFENYLQNLRNLISYRITERGACEVKVSIAGKQSRHLVFLIRKKDTGDFIISDDSMVLRQFRPHEKGQRDRVAIAARKFGFDIRDEELILESKKEELADSLHRFIQVISAVYIFYLS